MDVTLNNAQLLAEISDGLSYFSNFIKFRCSSNGIYGQIINPEQSAYVTLHFNSEGFEVFECEKSQENPLELGIPIGQLSNALKLCFVGDSLRLFAKENEEILNLKLENKAQGRITNLQLNLIDQLEFKNQFEKISVKNGIIAKFNPKTFNKIVNEYILKTNGEKVAIGVTNNSISFGVLNLDLLEGHITILSGKEYKHQLSLNLPDNFPKQGFRQIIHSENLKKVVKLSQLSSEFRICLEKGKPVIFEYSLNRLGCIRYFILTLGEEIEYLTNQ